MSRLEAWCLGLSSMVAAASGLVLFAMKHFLEPQDPYAVIHHPWQPAVLRLHLIAVPFLIFSVGMIMPVHVFKKMHDGRRRGRVSGLILLAVFWVMAVSGVLIQMMVDEVWLATTAWIHVGTGSLYVLLVLSHRRLKQTAKDAGHPGGVAHGISRQTKVRECPER
ncbi:MAG: hypothetical protein ACE5ID_04145 [Acidobacteriota bacterium]